MTDFECSDCGKKHKNAPSACVCCCETPLFGDKKRDQVVTK
jgi:hypothetical protein